MKSIPRLAPAGNRADSGAPPLTPEISVTQHPDGSVTYTTRLTVPPPPSATRLADDWIALTGDDCKAAGLELRPIQKLVRSGKVFSKKVGRKTYFSFASVFANAKCVVKAPVVTPLLADPGEAYAHLVADARRKAG